MPKKLRKGTAKYLLENSIESVLMAVEIYNKPKVQFKLQSYIALMVIGWTKAFHAYFHSKNIKYFYKKDGRYIKRDGEYKTWELSKCLNEYRLDSSVKENIKFFIGLRNKIEHRNLIETDIELITFGECQSLLYNYESFIVDNFGKEYALGASLAFALQFSTYNSDEQKRSQKRQLSKDVNEIKDYIERFRNTLTDDVFDSQKYSIKFLIIPKISNTKRGDLAIDFVREDSLTEEEYETITAVIKEKKIIQEAVNVKKYKPAEVVKIIRRHFRMNNDIKFNASYHHALLCRYFNVRPHNKEADPFDTDARFCLYDDVHADYVYTKEWVRFLIEKLSPDPVEKFSEIKALQNGENNEE